MENHLISFPYFLRKMVNIFDLSNHGSSKTVILDSNASPKIQTFILIQGIEKCLLSWNLWYHKSIIWKEIFPKPRCPSFKIKFCTFEIQTLWFSIWFPKNSEILFFRKFRFCPSCFQKLVLGDLGFSTLYLFVTVVWFQHSTENVLILAPGKQIKDWL